MNNNDKPLDTAKLMRIPDVLRLWPISRNTLWRWTHATREADRIPSYRIGGKVLYKYEELIHYQDTHRNNSVYRPPKKGNSHE